MVNNVTWFSQSAFHLPSSWRGWGLKHVSPTPACGSVLDVYCMLQEAWRPKQARGHCPAGQLPLRMTSSEAAVFSIPVSWSWCCQSLEEAVVVPDLWITATVVCAWTWPFLTSTVLAFQKFSQHLILFMQSFSARTTRVISASCTVFLINTPALSRFVPSATL